MKMPVEKMPFSFISWLAVRLKSPARLLAHRGQRVVVVRLVARQQPGEAVPCEPRHRLGVVGDEVGAPLGHPVLLHAAPFDLVAQHLEALLVDEEVVVEDEDERLFARFHLVDDAGRRQVADLALVELPDRAEVAVERAAPRREDRRHRPHGDVKKYRPVYLRTRLRSGAGRASRSPVWERLHSTARTPSARRHRVPAPHREGTSFARWASTALHELGNVSSPSPWTITST
jgi:hypothetical protein